MRIVFVNSWMRASHRGSGTTVGIRALERALSGAGHDVTSLRPLGAAGRLPARRLFNLTAPARLRRISADLVVGFDIDGWRWSESRPHGSAYAVALKGIAADEARFSRSRRERRMLDALGRLERRNVLGADRVLVPSAYSAAVATREYGVDAARIRIVPEPIDMAVWDELRGSREGGREASLAPGPSAHRPFTILSVARQYPRKNTATLLRAFPRVRNHVPRARLLVVGGGPELPGLRSLAASLGLEGAVTFAGAVASDEEVRRAHFRADVFCLPSLQEGFGIAFLEAMAAGLPVVAARAGALPELVADGETGVLVPPRDEATLADALIALLNDPTTRTAMGVAGLDRARRYDLPRVAISFMEAVSGI